MIPLLWDEIVALELGELNGAPADGVITRVHDDSRRARPGDLFVATQLRRAGSSTTRSRAERRRSFRTISTRRSPRSARVVRRRSTATVVAVVGSTGKTSTKDALAALCGAVTPTVAAEASKNNEIGLPLTVLRLEPDTKVLGHRDGNARPRPDRRAVRDRRSPSVVVIPNIGPEHLELVGTDRRRCAGERRGDRGASSRRDRGRPRRRARARAIPRARRTST